MGQIISLRADDHYTELVAAILKKTNLNRNQLLKVGVDLIAEKYLDPNHSGQFFDRETAMRIYREMANEELEKVERARLQAEKAKAEYEAAIERCEKLQEKLSRDNRELQQTVSDQIDKLQKRQEEVDRAGEEYRESKQRYESALREFVNTEGAKMRARVMEEIKAEMGPRVEAAIRQVVQWIREQHERDKDAELDVILRDLPLQQFATVN